MAIGVAPARGSRVRQRVFRVRCVCYLCTCVFIVYAYISLLTPHVCVCVLWGVTTYARANEQTGVGKNGNATS